MLLIINRYFKIIIINIIIFFSILIILETTFFILRILQDRPNLGWILVNEKSNIHSNSCLKMSTHPIYSHNHFHNGKCDIPGGVAVGEYVYYRNKIYDENLKILTLGGSTTDGWYIHYANGNTWPKVLDDKCAENKKLYKNCSVINGGVGGYNSSQELLKLLTSASILKQNIKVIISFNGINEIENYRGTNNFIETNLPFFTSEMALMYTNEKWFRQSDDFFNFFPNINSFIRYLFGTYSYRLKQSSQLSKEDFKDIYNQNSKINSVVERWSFNTSMMKKISEEMNSNYFVILQPSLGIKNDVHQIPINSNDYRLYKNLDDEYISSINILYKKLRLECNKKTYCFDLSNIILPDGNSYSDPRHHNENGNNEIANEILKIIETQLVN